VTRVETTRVGGNVVWMQPLFGNMRVYYAHLHEQWVEPGDFVLTGQPLGVVGNTGNAITTPPHLHFGIYRRGEGPTDPDPWLRAWEADVVAVSADTAALGAWMRVGVQGATVVRPMSPLTWSGATSRGPSGPPVVGSDSTVPARTIVRVLAAVADRYRVGLPDGVVASVRARDLEHANEPLGSIALAGRALRASPTADAPVIAAPDAYADGAILGLFGDHILVRGPGGVEGWSAVAAPD
jgi:hypothetical protein